MIQISKATLKAKLETAIVAFTRAGLDNDGDVVGLVYLVSALCGNLTQLVDEITPTSDNLPAGGCNEIDHLGHGHWVPEEAK